MAKYLVSDNATTTIATGISSGATSVTVQAGAGALFPSPNTSVGTKFLATFVSQSNPNNKEVVTCTARSTDTMTISPTNQSWNAGDTFALLNPAELFQQLVQFDDLQAQGGNYALDTGSANAYVVGLTPALSAHAPGTPIRFLAAHANTGASTFNDGAGAASLVLPGGSALPDGIIQANTLYEVAWNSAGSYFQLNWVIISSFSQLAGQVSAAQVPQGAVTQYAAVILANAALTGTPTAPTPGAGDDSTRIATTAFVVTEATSAAAAAANPGASIGNSGFQSFLSGLIIQWGQLAIESNTAQSVNFPEAFPNACFGVILGQPGPSSYGYTVPVTGWTTTGFTTDSQPCTPSTQLWIAFGH